MGTLGPCPLAPDRYRSSGVTVIRSPVSVASYGCAFRSATLAHLRIRRDPLVSPGSNHAVDGPRSGQV